MNCVRKTAFHYLNHCSFKEIIQDKTNIEELQYEDDCHDPSSKFTGFLVDSCKHNAPRKLILVGINLAGEGVYNKNFLLCRFQSMLVMT